MGYGDHRKGVDLFVEAALVTIEKRPDVYFVWVGNCDSGATWSNRAQDRRTERRDRILFPGFRPYVDVYFSGADVFLLSSREDPFPSVVLEAMDAGLPVIGFEDAGGFCDLLNEGGGLTVPYEDIAAAVRAIERLLDNDLLWQRVSTRAGAIVGEFQFPDYLYDLACYAGEHCPKVSVILPNYNYERYLSQRLLSVLRQTYRPYEVLFLDDCSTDESVGVAERILGSFDISFRIIRNTSNQGTFKQWIRGIREARGDLVWIAEADDFCEEGFLEVLGGSVPGSGGGTRVLTIQADRRDGSCPRRELSRLYPRHQRNEMAEAVRPQRDRRDPGYPRHKEYHPECERSSHARADPQELEAPSGSCGSQGTGSLTSRSCATGKSRISRRHSTAIAVTIAESPSRATTSPC